MCEHLEMSLGNRTEYCYTRGNLILLFIYQLSKQGVVDLGYTRARVPFRL